MAEVSQGDQSLSHFKWDCKYHVVFIPKKRRKALFGQARRYLGQIFHALARQKECQMLEGQVMPDHAHMCIAIPPKYPVADVTTNFSNSRNPSAVMYSSGLCCRSPYPSPPETTGSRRILEKRNKGQPKSPWAIFPDFSRAHDRRQ